MRTSPLTVEELSTLRLNMARLQVLTDQIRVALREGTREDVQRICAEALAVTASSALIMTKTD